MAVTQVRTAVELAELVATIGLRSGDVVITGCNSRLSEAVMNFTETDVSHCFLMTSPTRGIEGHDGIDDNKLQLVALSDDIPGVHTVTIDHELRDLSLNRIVVRRPDAELDTARLAAIADDYLARQTPFSGIALALHGLMIAADRAHEIRILEIADRLWDRLLGTFAHQLADGTERLVCAELVYRCLWESGVRIELVDPVHAEAIALLALSEASYDHGQMTTRSDRMWGPLIDDLEAVESAGAIDDVTRAMSMIFHHVPAALAERRTTAGTGDLADMVTPADFLRAEPFITIFSAARNEFGSWTIDHSDW